MAPRAPQDHKGKGGTARPSSSSAESRADTSSIDGQIRKDIGDQPTTAAEWRGRGSSGESVRLPSGNVALLRRPGMQAFLMEGMVPNSLLPLVEDAISSGKQMSRESILGLLKEPEKLQDIMQMYDRILLRVVVKPRVLPVPTDEDGDEIPLELRDTTDVIYIDEVDMDDKVFIYNFAVGGTRDLERFREESEATLELLDDVAEAPVPPK